MGAREVTATEFVRRQRRRHVRRRGNPYERPIDRRSEAQRHVPSDGVWNRRVRRKSTGSGLYARENAKQRCYGNPRNSTKCFDAPRLLRQNLTVKLTFSRVCEYVSDGIRLS
jgi:hypothetical protein